MNKSEFLKQLSDELRAKNVSNASDIIGDFEIHFLEATKDGHTEDEICTLLGDPSEIAEQCAYAIPEGNGSEDIENETNGSIRISIRSANLVLVPSNSENPEAHIERRGLAPEHEQDDFEIEQAGNSLTVKQVRPRSIATWVSKMLEANTVVVHVPKHFSGSIRVNVFSGNFEQREALAVKKLSAEITSGNIKLNNMRCECAEFRSTSGNIKLEQCCGDVTAKTFSGSIQIASHSGNVAAHSTSGNVSISTDTINKETTIKVGSGRINLELARLVANLSMQCTSGNINFTIFDLQADITAKTTSGNITGHLDRNTKARFMVNSQNKNNEFAYDEAPSDLPRVIMTSTSGTTRLKKM